MELKIGESYEVEVIKLIKGGVIVLVNEFNDTSLIHISKISTGFVSNIEDYVNIGDSLVAECVPSDIKGAELSLLQLNLKPKTKLPHKFDSKSLNRSKGYNYKSNSIKSFDGQSDKVIKPSIDDLIAKMNSDHDDKSKALSSRYRRRLK